MITEFNTLPKKLYYVQATEDCTVLDADGEPLAEINAPGGYFPGIGSAEASTGTVSFSSPVKRVIGPFDLAPQQRLAVLGVLGGDQLPAGYTRVAYLESTVSQYIDTGIIPRQGPLYHVTAEMVYFGEKNIYAPFMSVLGDQPEGSTKGRPRLSFGYTAAASSTQTRVLAANEGWNRSVSSVNPNLSHRYEVKIRRDDNFPELYFDGARLICEDVNPGRYVGDIQYPLFLFASNNWGSPGTLKPWRIYTCSLAEDETPKFSYIPALDHAGAPCMFDLVSKTPVYNSGSGAFIAGVETQVQLNNMLRKLPDRAGQDVGTLTVRLADELQTPENESKLEAMLAKNWEITEAL